MTVLRSVFFLVTLVSVSAFARTDKNVDIKQFKIGERVLTSDKANKWVYGTLEAIDPETFYGYEYVKIKLEKPPGKEKESDEFVYVYDYQYERRLWHAD